MLQITLRVSIQHVFLFRFFFVFEKVRMKLVNHHCLYVLLISGITEKKKGKENNAILIQCFDR